MKRSGRQRLEHHQRHVVKRWRALWKKNHARYLDAMDRALPLALRVTPDNGIRWRP